MKRNKFIQTLGFGTLAAMVPSTVVSFTPAIHPKNKILRFGVVVDVHKDLMPDANQRLECFISEAMSKDVDFIIQLGDFCMAESQNQEFLGIWNQFENPKFHVLGNHDMDRHTKEEMLDFWNMPKTYYSYDVGGYHFIVLDANFLHQNGEFVNYKNANFYVDDVLRTFVDPTQIAWFKSDLEATNLPTIVFSHQSLWHPVWGVKNRAEIQHVLEANSKKVISCMNGHNHIDYHFHKNDIDYIEINSMSYNWVGSKYKSTTRFSETMYQEYPNLPHIAGYKDPLFAFVTLNSKGVMEVEGVKSKWLSPSPYDMGMPKAREGSVLTAEISDYKIRF